MLVGSSVEPGSGGKVVVALHSEVIGYIKAAIGSGTLTRANGIAVRVR